MLDAAVVGGGLIGLASALELRRRGMTVRVYDRGDAGAQASWAAGGILGPQSEVHEPSPMIDLCRLSFELYPGFVEGLGDVGFRRNGTLHLAFGDADAGHLAEVRDWQAKAGLRIEERRHEKARLALFFPDEGQVDNRRLLTALAAACAREGVEIRREAVAALAELEARTVVLSAGSWSGTLAPLAVHPVRGQALLMEAKPPAQVVFGGGGYVVPRGGKTLVGATAENVGFDATPTKEGRAYLEAVAATLLPAPGRVVDHWAGLRPATPDARPHLGVLQNGVIVATGHYRNGVLLAPITARIVSALARGEMPPLDLTAFDPARRGPSQTIR